MSIRLQKGRFLRRERLTKVRAFSDFRGYSVALSNWNFFHNTPLRFLDTSFRVALVAFLKSFALQPVDVRRAISIIEGNNISPAIGINC